VVNRASIIELAARYRVPTIYQYDYFARNGGLVSYGVDVPDLLGAPQAMLIAFSTARCRRTFPFRRRSNSSLLSTSRRRKRSA
jgi:hypothetical protein